jgi:hypothetical protein
MAEAHRIFKKIRLTPTQLRTVAERRFADAEALRDTKANARANGTMYLAGFVVECLLKAKLLERYRWLQSASSPTGKTKSELISGRYAIAPTTWTKSWGCYRNSLRGCLRLKSADKCVSSRI